MSMLGKVISVLLTIALIAIGACTQYHYEGAATGGAVGGVAGALLDDENPWRGGLIGAALGAVFGATITDVSMRGSREAADYGGPVEYRTRTDDGGTAVYRADPVEYSPRTECHKVRERVWKDDQLVKDEVREVCESEKIERRY